MLVGAGKGGGTGWRVWYAKAYSRGPGVQGVLSFFFLLFGVLYQRWVDACIFAGVR